MQGIASARSKWLSSRVLLAASLTAFFSFATSAWGAVQPTAFTGEPETLTATSATLKGSLFPAGQPASYYFQYGATAAYTAQTLLSPAGAGAGTLHVTTSVAGLESASTYHDRLVAVTPSGTYLGQDRTFATKRIPLTFAITATPARSLFGSPFVVSGTLSGSGAAHHPLVLEGSAFPYLGGFKTLAGPLLTGADGAFSFSVPPLAASTQLRVATPETPVASSRVVVELVAVKVVLHIRAAARPGFVRLYGTVAPAEPAAVVRLQLLNPHTRASTIAEAVVLGSNGSLSRFARVVRLRRHGLYRAYVDVSGAQVSASSRPIRVG